MKKGQYRVGVEQSKEEVQMNTRAGAGWGSKDAVGAGGGIPSLLNPSPEQPSPSSSNKHICLSFNHVMLEKKKEAVRRGRALELGNWRW